MSTTLVKSITVSADDAFQYADGSGLSTAGSRLEATSSALASERAITGLRFISVAVPPGATILQARLLLRVSDEDDGADTMLSGEDADNPGDFSGDDIVSRTQTSTTVAWEDASVAVGAGRTTLPDVTAIMQEIVNRAGWASGNAIVFFVEGNANAPQQVLKFWAADTGAGLSIPVLTIVYATGAPIALSASETPTIALAASEGTTAALQASETPIIALSASETPTIALAASETPTIALGASQ